MMEITVNGSEITTKSEKLQTLLEEQDIDINEGGFAVAVNDALVTKSQVKNHQISPGDHVEIIRATQGG